MGHFRHFLRDLLQTKIGIKKSDKLLILCGDDVIIKRKCWIGSLISIIRLTTPLHIDDIQLKEIYSKKVDIDGWLYIKMSIES